MNDMTLEQLRERYRELCDEKYDLQCDTSGHVSQALSMAIGTVYNRILELEKEQGNHVQH